MKNKMEVFAAEKEITKEKPMTTKELAEALKTSSKVILENAKKCLPNKKIENGKPTYWSKMEVTVLLEFMKANNNRTDLDLYNRCKGVSTELSPALKLKKALELAQEAYEEELEILRAKNASLESKNENLKIELDESREWYSVKRMEKLNPGKRFDWRLLKKESEKLGKEIKKTFDQNYGEVNAYHVSVWESLYFDTVDFD